MTSPHGGGEELGGEGRSGSSAREVLGRLALGLGGFQFAQDGAAESGAHGDAAGLGEAAEIVGLLQRKPTRQKVMDHAHGETSFGGWI
jgi:hypothetical protein